MAADGRGVRVLGRALALPDTAATVRVRDGERLVTDGPFAETKEFLAGFDVLDCADLDEAIEVAARHPVSWFHAIEIRPFADGVRLGERASAFARADDSAGIPYRVPPPHLLPERTGGVLAVLYLLFNEGYAASAGEALIRAPLCLEAIRLARLLAALMPDEPEAAGLPALMLLHHSRRDARVDRFILRRLAEQQDAR